MPKVITDIFSSKKFLALIAGCAGDLVGAILEVITWDLAFKLIMGKIGLYIGAQSYADGQSGGMTSSMPGTPTAADLPKN